MPDISQASPPDDTLSQEMQGLVGEFESEQGQQTKQASITTPVPQKAVDTGVAFGAEQTITTQITTQKGLTSWLAKKTGSNALATVAMAVFALALIGASVYFFIGLNTEHVNPEYIFDPTIKTENN